MIRPTMRLSLSRVNQCLFCVRSCPVQRTSTTLHLSRLKSSAAAMEHRRSEVHLSSMNTSDTTMHKPTLPLFLDEPGTAVADFTEEMTTSLTENQLPVCPDHGHGIKYNNNGSVYIGDFQSSSFHGKGIIKFRDGSLFEGLFIEGRIARGEGKYCYDNGEVFEGSIVNNKRHGQGILYTPDGTVYESTWRGNRMFGECTVRYPTGETFTGEHQVKVTQDGYGWTVTPDGMMYEGEWRSGVYHGQGTLYTADGCVLQGLWKEGQMHGRGLFLDANGTLDTGVWTDGVLKADKRNRTHSTNKDSADTALFGDIDADTTTSTLFDNRTGATQVVDHLGRIYSGEMKNHRRHGQGKLIYNDGTVYEGKFVNDLPHGYGVYTISSHGGAQNNVKAGNMKRGEVYKGKFVRGKRHGKGQLISAAGDVFTGIFNRNVLESGSGTVTYPFGRSYTGAYRAGKRHGPGILMEEDGSKLEIQFVNDKPHGEGKHTNRHGKVMYELWDMGTLVKQSSQGTGRSAALNDSENVDNMAKEMSLVDNSSTGDVGTVGNHAIDASPDTATPSSSSSSSSSSSASTSAFAQRVFQAETVTIHFEDDSVFTGECLKGIPNGQGRVEYADGSQYVGSFSRGVKHGAGAHFYKPTNCTYKGGWERGYRHGKGLLTFHDTDESFAGEFQGGRLYSGEGVYYSANKVRFEGEFAYGYLVQGKVTYLDGSVYEGDLCDGMRHGQGTLRDKDGKVVHEGEWEEGEPRVEE